MREVSWEQVKQGHPLCLFHIAMGTEKYSSILQKSKCDCDCEWQPTLVARDYSRGDPQGTGQRAQKPPMGTATSNFGPINGFQEVDSVLQDNPIFKEKP